MPTHHRVTPALAAALSALTRVERAVLRTVAAEATTSPWLRGLLAGLVVQLDTDAILTAAARAVDDAVLHDLERDHDLEVAALAVTLLGPLPQAEGVAWHPEV